MVELKEIKEIIESNPLSLATTSKDGNPHVIAVADVKIVSDDKILIGDNYMKNTIENIKSNNNVALVVYDNTSGFGLKGIAEYFTEGTWLDKVKEIHEGYPAKGALLVTTSNIKRLG